MDYYSKYKKYKTKYLKIKKMLGGNLTEYNRATDTGNNFLIPDYPPYIDIGIYKQPNARLYRININNIDEYFSSYWGILLHREGHKLNEEVILHIFKYGLFQWYLHYSIYLYIHLYINADDKDKEIDYDEILATNKEKIIDFENILKTNQEDYEQQRTDVNLFIHSFIRLILEAENKEQLTIENIKDKIGNTYDFFDNFIQLIRLKNKEPIELILFNLQKTIKFIGKENLIFESLGIAFFRLKIISEKMGFLIDEKIFNPIDTDIYFKINKILEIIQTMIFIYIRERVHHIFYKFIKRSSIPISLIYLQNNIEFEKKEEYKKIIRNISFLTNPIDDTNLDKYILPADLNDI